MSIGGIRLCVAVCLLITVSMACAQEASSSGAQDFKELCRPVAVTEPACSYTALNPSCNLFINRFSPVAPPTIYARHGAIISVTVVNQSAFEKLTLDLKSLTAQVPPDQLANGFAALNTALGSFAIIEPVGEEVKIQEVEPSAGDTVEKVLAAQTELKQDITKDCPEEKKDCPEKKKGLPEEARTALQQLKVVLLPFPAGVCQRRDPAQDLEPLLHTTDWLKTVKGKLETAKNYLSDPPSDTIEASIKSLERRIYGLALNNSANAYQLQILRKNQDSLSAALVSRDQIADKLDALAKALDKLAADVDALAKKKEDDKNANKKPEPDFTISDPQPHDRNYQIVTSILNYTNRLAPVAKRVGGEKFLGDDATLLSTLGDAPAKQPILTLSVQYMDSPRFEISAGFLVPFTPYHSYSAAQTETASAPVVRESLTYTVVPAAMINFLIGREWIMARQRAALLGTFAVGYTPATSSVALAFGPSFSWKSVVISPLADLGRDVQLAGGFTVGGPLGSSTTPATAPLTKTVWDMKPAIGMSIRIPLGGSGH